MAIALPAGYVALVHPRSGRAVKQGVTVLNAPGTIDAGYRGEIKVPLINLDPERAVTSSIRRPHRTAGHPTLRRGKIHRGAALPGSDRARNVVRINRRCVLTGLQYKRPRCIQQAVQHAAGYIRQGSGSRVL